jgi:hypothetical protein
MRTITITAVLILGMAAPCFGVGDPVSSTTKSESQETTTYRRDGKTILKSILYHSVEPERRMLRQVVFSNDKVVAEITDFRGKRCFTVNASSPVSAGLQSSSTGAWEDIVLTDNAATIVDVFEVKGSQLIPISGKRLDLTRSVTTDVKKILSPENVKKTNPQEFRDQIMEFVKKHETEESDNQEINDASDKPTPQDSSRKESH